MAGWHSLSGFLFYKPGGALWKLKRHKKLWYEYEDDKQQLVYYKNQDDANSRRDAIGNIDINSAAITLSLNDNNQFIIISDGREYMLTAENHESMMIWLLGLQAKRDACATRNAQNGSDFQPLDALATQKKKRAQRRQFWNQMLKKSTSWWDISQTPREEDEPDLVVPVPKELSSPDENHSEPIQSERESLSNMFRRNSLQSRSDFQRNRLLRSKMAESMDAGLDQYSDGPEGLFNFGIPHSRSNDGGLLSSSGSSGNNSIIRHPSLGQISEPGTDPEEGGRLDSLGSMDGWSPTEEVFHEESEGFGSSIGLGGSCDSRRLRHMRRLHSDITEGKLRSALHEDTSDIRGRSNSGQSASSDSALERGSESELEKRLGEIEQELMKVSYYNSLARSTKCELAKMKNRETCYETILKKRDSLISELDGKVEQLQEVQRSEKSQSGKRADKRMREQTRILQNQNRFLNEEVKKLARLLQNERQKFKEQENKQKTLQAAIDKWKRDYVYLLQTCITVPSGDLTDGMAVNLYGGDVHKLRVQSLLNEERVTNPSLPTLERLLRMDTHIDNYGFKHTHQSEGIVLHYVCQQLHHYYSAQLSSFEEHQHRWKEVLTRAKSSLISAVNKKELKALCRRGIPTKYRTEIWKQLVVYQIHDIKEEKGPHYYSNLVRNAHESECAGQYRKQISLDLLRTMPTNINFSTMGCQGIQKLQEVLQAFCSHNPTIGYCQGMNFITAMFLLFMDVEDAFWSLVAITERYFAINYFDQYLSGAQADQEVLGHLMKDKLPMLAAHLESLDIEISTVTLNWFLAIFFDALPFETLLRVWDCFLLEGPKVLFRFALAILRIHEVSILKKGDTISIMRHLKSCAALTYDMEGLVRMAFEGLKPFPRRQNIASKQAVYLKTLKEKLKKQEMYRRAYDEKETILRELDLTSDCTNTLMFECAATADEGVLWVCYGSQNSGLVCTVNLEEGLLYTLDVELDSRIMCMCVLQDIVLLGTLGQNIHAFSVPSREELWSIHMHDTVLGLACREEDDYNIVFAALADGTIAVMENVDDTDPLNDPLYIPIGRSPVTALMLVDMQLWCACGNTVLILHSETLDTMDKFVTSCNPFDHILMLVWSEEGVWISTKGSSIVELWDPQQLVCKMLYDVKTNKHPTLKREEDCSLNMARITTLLPLRGEIWVGTGDGNLIMFDIHVKHGNIKEMPLTEKPEQQLRIESPISPNRTSPNRSISESEHKPSGRKSRKERITDSRERLAAQKLDGNDSSGSNSDQRKQVPKSPLKNDTDEKGKQRISKSPHRQRREEAILRGEYESKCKKKLLGGNVDDSFKQKHFPGDDNAIAEHRHTEENKHLEKQSNGELHLTEMYINLEQGSGKAVDESPPGDVVNANNKEAENNALAGDKEESRDGNSSEEDSTKVEVKANHPPLRKARRAPPSSSESSSDEASSGSGSSSTEDSSSDSTDSGSASVASSSPAHSNKKGEIISKETNNNEEGKRRSIKQNGVTGPDDEDVMKVVKPPYKAGSDSEDNSLEVCVVADVHQSDEPHSEDTCVKIQVNEVSNGDGGVEEVIHRKSGEEVLPNGDGGVEEVHRKSAEEVLPNGDGGVEEVIDRKSGEEILPNGPLMDRLDVPNSMADSQSFSDNSESSRGTIGNASGDSTVEEIVVQETPDIRKETFLSQMMKKVQKKEPLPPAESQVMAESQVTHGSELNEDHGDAKCNDSSKDSKPKNPIARLRQEGKIFKGFGKDKNMNDGKHVKDARSKIQIEIHGENTHRKAGLSLALEQTTSTWSSFEEISQGDLLTVNSSSVDSPGNRSIRHLRTPSNASSSSLPSDVPYMCELSLQAKIKISDKPIRCLIHTCTSEEPVIISCAGCFGDDEAVLKWRKEEDEKLWTNEPIFEVCPQTRMPKTPMYLNMRNMSNTSLKSLGSTESLKNFMGGSSRKQSLVSTRSLPFDLGNSMSSLWQ